MADLNNVLGLLPSFSNYKKLENWSHLGLEDICSALKNDIKSVPDFYDICMNIIGVLEYLEYPVSFTLYDNKKCTVFALWMYDYLIKYFKNDDNYSKTRAVIEIMNERFSKYSEKLGCKIPSYINNETHVDNLKKLYDYATNYDTILHHITDKGNKCSQEYSKYIKERIDLLKKVKSDCYDKSENHCEVYKNIFGSSIDEKFFSLQCNSLGSQEISAIKETSHVQEWKEQITNDGTTKTSNIIMGTALPVVGSIFTMPFLYKFTPFGSWIKNLLRGNVKTSHNYYNIKYELQKDLPDPQALDSLRNELNIPYGPA